jgi:hypothetical protein
MIDIVNKVLTDAGWFKNRNIDISVLEKVLINDKYIVFKCAKDFLSEFGLLKITFKNPRSDKNVDIEIDTRKAITFKSKIDAYGCYFNTNMLPVAEVERFCMIVCISEDGKFYGGYDETLLKLGNSFEEALYNLMTGVQLEKVYVRLDP